METATATAASAFESYLAIRGRLPALARTGGRYRRVETLGEIAGPYGVILLDAYGVLNVGEWAVPGARERILELRASGKRVIVVSNSAGYPKRVMMTRFARLGSDGTISPAALSVSRNGIAACSFNSAGAHRARRFLVERVDDALLCRHDDPPCGGRDERATER